MNKLTTSAIGMFAIIFIALCVIYQFAHKLENQELAIVQSISGDVEVRQKAGWWIQISPTISRYPKAGVYRLNSRDRDSLDIQFKNKSKAKMNVAIGYRIDNADDATLIALHQQVEGEDEVIWGMVLTALNTVAQQITTKYDPSDVIGGDKFEVMISEMYKAIMHNSELKAHGIDVNYFAVDGRPLPDADTEEQFNKQREADLARRLAETEKIKLEAEALRTKAQYEKEIVESEGKAKSVMAKEIQDAEREKKLAEIAAQQKVEVEKLEKEQMLIKASKELEVAEIAKQTEAKQLEIIRIKAEQQIAQAEAKKVAIDKSGAITEFQKAKIELERQTAQYKWENIGKGISNLKLPSIMNMGGNGSTASNPLNDLISALALEKIQKVSDITSPSSKPTISPSSNSRKR